MANGFLFDDMADPEGRGAYGPRSRADGLPAHNGSATSAAAARSIAPLVGTIRRRVLDFVRSQPDGATADEIEAALGLSGNTVRPRLIELQGRESDGSDRFIRQTERTRLTHARRKAVVYEAIG